MKKQLKCLMLVHNFRSFLGDDVSEHFSEL